MQNWCGRRNSLRSESFQAKKTDEHNHCILTASNLFSNNYNTAKVPAVLLTPCVQGNSFACSWGFWAAKFHQNDYVSQLS